MAWPGPSRIPALALLAAAVLAASGAAVRADDFFAGRTISMATHVAPGDGYDTFLRLLARHMGRHIPGRPAMVVVNQPGAGGLLSLNHASRRAPQDGTWLALVSQGLILHEALEKPGIEASLGTFKWIGNLSSSNNVTATWYLSGIKTIHDAMKRDVTVGSTGAGAITSIVPAVMNSIIGTRFKIITGYQGGAAQNLAMQRGELDGRSVNTWAGYKALQPDAILNNHLHILVQIALKSEPDLPHVPLLIDLVKGDERKESIARFLSLGMTASRPVAAPPGVPDSRVALLRAAFDATMRDPAFLADADKMKVEISPHSGTEVEAIVRAVVNAPVDIRRMVAAVAK
jgi:tripartite-type tricarboxylate transporter receptor subunit TctC